MVAKGGGEGLVEVLHRLDWKDWTGGTMQQLVRLLEEGDDLN